MHPTTLRFSELEFLMFSSTAGSTSLSRCPVASRIEYLAEPMLTLSSTSADCWTNDRPDTADFSDHQIEALICALIRWDQPPINRLLAGLAFPLVTDEDWTAARRRLPFLVEAIIDVLKEKKERGDAQAGSDQEVDKSACAERLDPRAEDSMLKIIAGAAVEKYGYRGPNNRKGAVSKIKSGVEKVGLPITEKTVRRYVDNAYEHIPLKNRRHIERD